MHYCSEYIVVPVMTGFHNSDDMSSLGAVHSNRAVTFSAIMVVFMQQSIFLLPVSSIPLPLDAWKIDSKDLLLQHIQPHRKPYFRTFLSLKFSTKGLTILLLKIIRDIK